MSTPSEPELPPTVTIPADVLWQVVDDEVVVLDATAGEYRGLDDVGTHMWLALDSAPDVAAAYERLCGMYDVDAETLRRDLAEFIGKLVNGGLLTTP
jgi:hypothetical protein